MKFCDFCSSSHARWRYPARSFLVPFLQLAANIVQSAIGDWHACDVCHRLIETDATAVAVRMTVTMILRHPDLASHGEAMLSEFQSLYRLFTDNRTGPAVEVGEQDEPQESNLIMLSDADEAQTAIDLSNSGLNVQQVRTFMEAEPNPSVN
jgi:hypothetical protein